MILHSGLGSALLLHVVSAGGWNAQDGCHSDICCLGSGGYSIWTASTARGWLDVKNREESLIYPACKLTSQRCWQKSYVSHREDLITHGTEISISFMFAWVPLLSVPWQQNGVTQVDVAHRLGLCHSWGILSLGNSKSYKGAANKHVQLCPWGRKHYRYYPGQEANLPFAQEEDPISVLQGSLLYKHPWKDNPRQKLSKGM